MKTMMMKSTLLIVKAVPATIQSMLLVLRITLFTVCLSFFVTPPSQGGESGAGADAAILTPVNHLLLSKVKVWEGDYVIDNTDTLEDIEGIKGYGVINGDLSIYDTSLIDLSDLGSLRSVVGTLFIGKGIQGVGHGNSLLNSLNGLQGVSELGGLYIGNNASLTTISALMNIGNLSSGEIYITSNNALTSLDGLEGITSVLGILKVGQNNALVSAAALRNIEEVGQSVEIDNNLLLSNIDLSSLATVSGSVDITDNPSLETMETFDELLSMTGFFNVANNDTLVSIGGLPKLSSVGVFKVTNNPVLASLNFPSLVSCTNDFFVYDNDLISTNGVCNERTGVPIGRNIRVCGNLGGTTCPVSTSDYVDDCEAL